jgi:hypothetical protein
LFIDKFFPTGDVMQPTVSEMVLAFASTLVCFLLTWLIPSSDTSEWTEEDFTAANTW